jgi:glutamyl-tRNA reductase
MLAGMSGTAIGRALRERFESVRRTELNRLERKLRGLSDHERASAEAIIADVVDAIARTPARALADTSHHPRTLQAIVRLFGLELQ